VPHIKKYTDQDQKKIARIANKKKKNDLIMKPEQVKGSKSCREEERYQLRLM